MSSAVCPYCRAPFDDINGQAIECEGCGTPHHADCYEENCGCTVFGCAKAPGEEPKVAVSVPEVAGVQLSGVQLAGVSRPVYLAAVDGHPAPPMRGPGESFRPWIRRFHMCRAPRRKIR